MLTAAEYEVYCNQSGIRVYCNKCLKKEREYDRAHTSKGRPQFLYPLISRNEFTLAWLNLDNENEASVDALVRRIQKYIDRMPL